MVEREWRAICARVEGVLSCAELMAASYSKNGSDLGMQGELKVHVSEINSAMEQWAAAHRDDLPAQVVSAIRSYVGMEWPTQSLAGPLNSLATGLSRLRCIQAQVTYLLADRESGLRLLTERAFGHLQRSIAVDPEFRAKWIAALGKGELACEQLGALHLLWHGVFAFKIDATGARTDLVYSSPLEVNDASVRSSSALVLTEWKLARSTDDPKLKALEARKQGDSYKAGALLDLELRTCRFAVVVSEHQIQMPQDVTENGATWKHVNIAVDPLVPSAVSKRK